jgi:hypothetical protein
MCRHDGEPKTSVEEVRREALGAHAELRERMLVVLALYVRVDWDRAEDETTHQLCERLQELIEAVERHLSMEDEKLAPVLATLDAWGDQRRAQLEQVHERERKALGRARSQEPSVCDTRSLASSARYLVDEVLRSLNWEESHLLDPEVFRDDCIVTSQLGG